MVKGWGDSGKKQKEIYEGEGVVDSIGVCDVIMGLPDFADENLQS